ncbi:MAG TPA: hypothetical protein VI078_00570 [bacterium]
MIAPAVRRLMSSGTTRRTATALTVAIGLVACQRTRPFEYEFERRDILDELQWQCGAIYRLSASHATSGRSSLEMTLYPASAGNPRPYPGITFASFDPDWSRRRLLRFDAYNPAANNVPLTLRIDDAEYPDFPERFNRTFSLVPGANRIAVPLPSLVTSGSHRPLRRESIRRVFIFVANPRAPVTIYLDDVRLD